MLEALAALLKWLLYLGSLSSAGSILAVTTLGRQAGASAGMVSRVVGVGAALVMLSAIGGVLILLVQLGGVLAPGALAAVWESPVGLAAGLQTGGAAAMLLGNRTSKVGGMTAGLGAAAVLASFGVAGHAAGADAASGVVAFLHVGAAAWWLGALLLLRRACTTLGADALVHLVRRFSHWALAVVTLLVVLGTVLIATLVDFSGQLRITPYLTGLAAKLALAVFVLGVAAYNKLRLTPRLTGDDPASARRALRRTIGIESTAMAGVLAATAVLTTFTSPHP